MSKPEFNTDYYYFIEETWGVGLKKLRDNYDEVTKEMFRVFNDSTFLKELNENLKVYNEEYIKEKKYDLFTSIKEVKILVKDFEKMLFKCYRRDILQLTEWNDAIKEKIKESGHNPCECYNKIGDILRTRISVRYFDGVEFMIEKLKELSKKHGLTYNDPDYKAEDVGYYAIHFDLNHDFEVPAITTGTRSIKARIEIQIMTDVQDLIIDLSHKYYEERRKKPATTTRKWQWKYKSDDFLPNYLGHIIHYIEGMIMEVRDKLSED